MWAAVNQQASAGPGRLVAVGAAAGLLGGFFGVGGGIILVPLLVMLGFGRHRAHATSLAAFILIASAGAVSYGVADDVSVPAGITIGIGGIAGSIAGASLMNRLSARTLTIIFSFVLFAAALRMIFGSRALSVVAELDPLALALAGIGIGLISGAFAGLAGIGGGVVIVPAGVLFLGLGQHTAQGTSLVAITLTAIAGSAVNLRNRRVRLIDGLWIGLGGAVGALAGSRLALGIEGRSLSVVFGVFVLLVGLRSLYGAFRPSIV